MKNKTVILILSVLAVAMYTVAVINFCLGNVLGGIGDVLMASFGALMAYALYRVGQLGRMADATRKAVTALLERCGLLQSNIARVERGYFSARFDTLEAMAEGLGKKIDIV